MDLDLSFNYEHPRRTSPSEPQNLLRVTNKGCTNCGGSNMSGMGLLYSMMGTGVGRTLTHPLMGLAGLGDATAEETPSAAATRILGLAAEEQHAAIDAWLNAARRTGAEVGSFSRALQTGSADLADYAMNIYATLVQDPSYGATQSALSQLSPTVRWTLVVIGLTAGAISAYHGYKRNNSLGWGVWWYLMGTWFPFITLPVAFAQGYGRRASGTSGMGRALGRVKRHGKRRKR